MENLMNFEYNYGFVYIEMNLRPPCDSLFSPVKFDQTVFPGQELLSPLIYLSLCALSERIVSNPSLSLSPSLVFYSQFSNYCVTK